MRLDQWLVTRGHFPSRTRAQAAIKAGLVRVDGRVIDRPSYELPDGEAGGGANTPGGVDVQVEGDPVGYVGRGGLKLAGALDDSGLDVTGWLCLDVGASTGGFTDCLLQRGARHVWAVDVGSNQLHPRLRADARVTSLENQDIRALPPDLIPQPVDLAVIDVSFISLTKVLPSVLPLLRPGGRALALVKPQFEVGPQGIGKGGVVREPALRQGAVEGVAAAARAGGWRVWGSAPSRIAGGDGNQEFFLHLGRLEEDTE